MSFAPKHLLVPVDLEPFADPGLAVHLVDEACSFAKAYDARLTILHVAAPVDSPIEPVLDTAARRAMADVVEARNAASARALANLVQRAEAAGVVAAPLVTTRAGAVPEIIVAVAEEQGADIIVLTTHARRGIRRLFLGSVAERTAHLSPRPVLLLPPPH